MVQFLVQIADSLILLADSHILFLNCLLKVLIGAQNCHILFLEYTNLVDQLLILHSELLTFFHEGLFILTETSFSIKCAILLRQQVGLQDLERHLELVVLADQVRLFSEYFILDLLAAVTFQGHSL